MNQQILDYLNQNKENYSKEQLINALLSVGYKKEDIDQAIVFVYQVPMANNQIFSNFGVTQNALGQSVANQPLQNFQNIQVKPKSKLTKQQKINFAVKFFGAVGVLLIFTSVGIYAYRYFNKKEVSGDVLSGMVENTKVSDDMDKMEKGMVKNGEYKINKSTQMSNYSGLFTLTLDSVEATSLDLKFNVSLSFVPSTQYSYGYVSFYDAKLIDNNSNEIPKSKADNYYSYSPSLAESFYKDPSPKKGYIMFSQTNNQADSYTLNIDEFAPIEGIILK